MDEIAMRTGARVAHHVAAAALAARAAIAAPNAVAAVDIFLKIGDIKGESTDSKHKGEIDVPAWSWGPGPKASPGQKMGSNSTCAQQLALTKYVDSATPQLIKNAVLGATSSEATLTVRKAGERPIEYLTATLKSVIVSAVSTGGSGVEDRLTENLTLGFASASVTYTPQEKDGKPGAPVKDGTGQLAIKKISRLAGQGQNTGREPNGVPKESLDALPLACPEANGAGGVSGPGAPGSSG